MEKLTVNELFAGIGAFRKALINLNIPHEIVGISEIDKYAIKSYEAMYGKTRNYGDISKVERLDYADLWAYGFPCQDVSLAGKKQGIIKGKTRSGLLHEVERLLEVAKEEGTLPKYLILENVKNLLSERFKGDFEKWIEYLSDLGYETKWENSQRPITGFLRKERESLRYQSEKTYTGDSSSQNLFLSEFSTKTCWKRTPMRSIF